MIMIIIFIIIIIISIIIITTIFRHNVRKNLMVTNLSWPQCVKLMSLNSVAKYCG